MLPILAALTSGLAFTGLQIIFKRHSKPGASPFAIPAYMGLLAPTWLVLLLTTNTTLLDFNLTPAALIFPAMWAVCTVTTTTLLVWLLSRFSLTEVAGYKKALITFGALLADIYLFSVNFHIYKVAAIGFLLFGALTLSQTRHRIPTPSQALILLAWCSLLTLQITLYKTGQLHQPQVLANTILCQLMSTSLYALLWLLPSVRRQTPLPTPALLGILACAFIGVSLEGFAYFALPLAVVMLVTILPATLFAAHDLYRGDLRPTPLTLRALLALAGGFTLLFLSR